LLIVPRTRVSPVAGMALPAVCVIERPAPASLPPAPPAPLAPLAPLAQPSWGR
jgi:hypothetical protein